MTKDEEFKKLELEQQQSDTKFQDKQEFKGSTYTYSCDYTLNINIVGFLECLNELEKNIVKYKVFEDYTFREIAVLVNKSKSRIEQIYKNAIKKLKQNYLNNKYFRSLFDSHDEQNPIVGNSEYGFPFVNLCMTQRPCILMANLHKSFGDNKSCCPGSYNAKGRQQLICSKSYMKTNYDGIVNTEECARIMKINPKTISDYVLKGKLRGKKVKGRYVIDLHLRQCDQNVFNPSIHRYNEFLYCLTAIQSINEYIANLWCRLDKTPNAKLKVPLRDKIEKMKALIQQYENKAVLWLMKNGLINFFIHVVDKMGTFSTIIYE